MEGHFGNILKNLFLHFEFQEAENRQKVPIVAEVAMDDAFVDSSDEEDMMAEEDLYQDEDDDDDEVDEDSEDEYEEKARHGNRRARLEWDNNI